MKRFTVEEAEALIPELERIFAAIGELAAQAEAKAASLQRRDEESDAVAAAIDRSQLQFLARGIQERLQEISALGAVPKGVEPALVDFPARLAGRDVYLCWKLGERAIAHYHGVEDGFAGRKPLPRRKP
ncbi:MAG: DUF2203 domain-containing protein [Elusimicrobia bacterium]|nr:DUF2203 domain-containing protein [Elusimicrobiota bacterium]